jgi:hypothetical protein
MMDDRGSIQHPKKVERKDENGRLKRRKGEIKKASLGRK